MKEISLKDILPTLDQYSDALTAFLAGQEHKLPDSMYLEFNAVSSVAQLRRLVLRKSFLITKDQAAEFLSLVLARAAVLDPESKHRESIIGAISSAAEHSPSGLHALAVRARDYNIL